MYQRLFIGIFAGLVLFAAPVGAWAQTPSGVSPGAPSSVSPGAPSGNAMFTLKNPLSFNNICGLFKAIFNTLMIIGVPVAVFFIVYAGFLFVVARGRPEKLGDAKRNAAYVAVGIAVFLGAWFLAQIIAATIQALGGPGIMSC